MGGCSWLSHQSYGHPINTLSQQVLSQGHGHVNIVSSISHSHILLYMNVLLGHFTCMFSLDDLILVNTLRINSSLLMLLINCNATK